MNAYEKCTRIENVLMMATSFDYLQNLRNPMFQITEDRTHLSLDFALIKRLVPAPTTAY